MKQQLLDRTKEELKNAKRIKKWLDKQTEELTRIDEGTKHLEKYLVSAYIDSANRGIDLNYSGGKLVLDAIFAAYRKLGYEPGKRPESDKLTSFSCYWYHPEQTLKLWITFSSTVCRRVKVGTKTVEQDVYETVCDE